MKSYPKTLIVILNYSTYQLTLRLVEELGKLIYPNYEIMVVDNASPNESAVKLAEMAELKNYIFYKNDVNSGYAAGNNIGIRYAISHGFVYTWILNNDVLIKDMHILRKMVEVADMKTDIGCVGPQIYYLDGIVYSPYCTRPNLWSMTLGIAFDKYKRKKQSGISQKVYRVHGCCMLLRNSVMRQINCMDESTFLYEEENILAERMLKAGYYTFYYPETSIIHMESESVKKTQGNRSIKRLKTTFRSMDIYLKKYRHYNYFSRLVCKAVRGLIIIWRG